MEIGLVQSKSSYRSIPDHRHYRLLLTLIGDHLLPCHYLSGLNLQASLLGYSDVASLKFILTVWGHHSSGIRSACLLNGVGWDGHMGTWGRVAHYFNYWATHEMSFHGHDESQDSSDKGKFLELLQFLGNHNESINEVLQKAPKNYKLTHSDIQKDIVNAIARETSKAIIKDLDNEFFSLLVDESFIDIQLQELNNHFSEANTNLLLCMACLNPSNSFVAFDKEKLIHLAKFYLSNFLGTNILALDSQLQNYIFNIRSNDLFLELQGVSELAEKLVNTRKYETYPLVYLLVRLTLTLPVTTATVE
ncbi:uncharacterized protein LOC126701110 [Quercus robur]|uniref:uncharacterized protein LOC126701110 n=1 Tax=Quercus robur TaxID=38942 RepID=UPI00216226CF|nr:uncharacterized protein LOC126701110 [Quercus robur]